MSRSLRNWVPTGLAVFTCALSLFTDHHSSYTAHLTTSVMAVCATLGWAAIVLFLHGQRRRLNWHLAVAVAVPLCTRVFPGLFFWEPFWHWFLYGLMLFSFLGLSLFIRRQKPYRPRS